MIKYFQNVINNLQLLQFPCVPLIGNVICYPELLILSHLPNCAKTMDKKVIKAIHLQRQVILKLKSQDKLNGDLDLYQKKVLSFVM